MKIHIKNFGPISSFSFDLEKDLHVLYGKNNIGKSYAISVVYLILKTILNVIDELPRLSLGHDDINSINKVKQISLHTEKLTNNKQQSISIKSDYEQLLTYFLTNSFLVHFSESFRNTFFNSLSLKNSFSQEDFEIILFLDALSFSIKLDSSNQLSIDGLKLPKGYSVKLVANKKSISKDEEIKFYFDKNKLEKSKMNLEVELYKEAMLLLHNNFSKISNRCNDVFFLPASRSGLYEAMSIFSSIFARLSQLRHQIKGNIEIPALSEPMSDYFLNLSTIRISKETTDIYYGFAKEIEEKILNAQIEFNNENKKLEYFNKKLKLRLDLGETSSMVSEIAPIVAYLKYIINEKLILKNGLTSYRKIREERDKINRAKIIFIEEPEAHLHPEIQILLTDIFARLTKHNIKIVLTTHSNYIFNKVNNLILSKELATDRIANYHIIHTEKGSIVKEESELTEEGMEDDNFVPVAEQLYNERLKIYENQN
ncbi:MAG: AAA family ATPase [Saprospiraceae bacterium]